MAAKSVVPILPNCGYFQGSSSLHYHEQLAFTPDFKDRFFSRRAFSTGDFGVAPMLLHEVPEYRRALSLPLKTRLSYLES
jgi:hypothetical protein